MTILKKSANSSPFSINGLGQDSECPHDADDSRSVWRRHGRMVRAYAQLDLKLRGVVEAIDEHLTRTKVSN
jgi:hypothetical protein